MSNQNEQSMALTVPTPIKPKPKKAEIIDALTKLQVEQLKKQKDEAKIKADALRSGLEKRLTRFVREKFNTLAPRISFGYLIGYSADRKLSSVEVEFEYLERHLPDELKAQIVKYHDASKDAGICISESDIKRRIKMKLMGIGAVTTSERVQSLLDDKSSRSALEEILKTISK